MYGSDDVRTHPRDLQFELMLDASPLGDDIADIANDEFLRYCSWLREIEAK
jgi:hypothetical protein